MIELPPPESVSIPLKCRLRVICLLRTLFVLSKLCKVSVHTFVRINNSSIICILACCLSLVELRQLF